MGIPDAYRELRILADSATSAPWDVEYVSPDGHPAVAVGVGPIPTGITYLDDLMFVSAARTAVPALLADRDALAAEVERLKAEQAFALEEGSAWIAALRGDRDAARARVADLEAETAELRRLLGQRIARIVALEAELAEARKVTTPERLAQRFHETYERLAPEYDYRTREASAVPWNDVPENNKALMTAVCAEILTAPGPPVAITPPDERNPVSGLIGLFATQHTDLARRAKDIARGRDGL